VGGFGELFVAGFVLLNGDKGSLVQLNSRTVIIDKVMAECFIKWFLVYGVKLHPREPDLKLNFAVGLIGFAVFLTNRVS